LAQKHRKDFACGKKGVATDYTDLHGLINSRRFRRKGILKSATSAKSAGQNLFAAGKQSVQICVISG
jgi:hypothetical protein